MEKQIITFSANEQTLTKTGGVSNYSSNKVSYIEAHFDLGTNWSGYDSVRAIWFNDFETIATVLNSLGECVVPYEVLTNRGKVRVNLVGSISENDVLTDRITSYPICAFVVDAVAKVDGSNTEPITPSQFEQFAEGVRTDADRAEAGAESAETSAENALASAQASEASALSASNSASDASNSADRVAQMVAEVIAEIEEFEGVTVTVETLPAGSQATASFADGVLHLGIPRGDRGEQGIRGPQGIQGETGATGNGIESIELTSTSGAVKTYTILFTDGTSTTFDVTDGEVTQAVLDETVSELKADIDAFYVEGEYFAWQGYYSGYIRDNGAIGNSSNLVRSNFSSFKGIRMEVKPLSGYKIRIAEYATYDDSSTLTRFIAEVRTTDVVTFVPDPTKWYVIDVTDVNGTSVTPSNVPSNVVTSRYIFGTDESLQIANKSADAKAVGDQLGVLNDINIGSMNKQARETLIDILKSALYTENASAKVNKLNRYLLYPAELAITATGKRYSQTGGDTDSTYDCTTEYYPIDSGETHVIIYFAIDDLTQLGTEIVQEIDGTGAVKGYVNMGNSGRQNVEYDRTMNSSATFIGFTLNTASVQKSYAYFKNSGNLLFAGSQSIYAGYKNINQKGVE